MRTTNRLGRLIVASALTLALVSTAQGQPLQIDIRIKHDWVVGPESFPVGLREYEGGFVDGTFIFCGDNYLQTTWSAPTIALAAASPLAVLLALGILAIACSGARRSRSKDS